MKTFGSVHVSTNQKTGRRERSIELQVKSLYSYDGCTTIDKRRFDPNDYVTTFDYALSQPCFVYIIGLRDERLEKKRASNFTSDVYLPAGFCGALENSTRMPV